MMKSVLKRTISTLLALTLVATMFCIFDPSDAFPTAQASVSATVPTYDNLYFVVPEAIYLAPVYNAYTATTSSAFQYYVNQTLNGATISTRTGEQTTGNIYFNYPNAANNVTISFRWQNSPGSNMSDTAAITLSGSGYSTSLQAGAPFTTQSGASAITITGGSSPAMAASTAGLYIEWTATYTDSMDGQTKTAYAYTYVYKPYVYPIGVAHRTINSRGSNHYGQNLSWISGVHGTKVSRDRYPTVNTQYGFLPFSSGSTLTPQLPNYFYSTGFNNVGSQGWVNGDSSCAPDMSCHFFESTSSAHTAGDDEVLNFAYSATGLLTVDNSRYSNLNQIPNLTLGLMVTDDESSDYGDAYFIANRTTNSPAYTSDFTDYWTVNETTLKSYWNTYYEDDRIVYSGNYGSWNSGSESDGVRVNCRWRRSISSAAASDTYYLGAGYANHDSNDRIANITELRCYINMYNKSALRSAYQNAMKSFAQNNAQLLKSEYWNKFITLYRAVAKELCRVDGTFQTVSVDGNTHTSAQSLANALNSMTATCSVNNPTVRDSYAAVQKNIKVSADDGTWKLVGSGNDKSVSSFYKGARLTFAPESFNGYMYAGFTTTTENQATVGAPTTGQPDAVSSGSYTVDHAAADTTAYFYYVRQDYSLTFDANGGNEMTGMDYNIDSTAALPAATRNGYIFAGWKPTTSVGSWNSAGTYAAGTSLNGKYGSVTLEAQWSTQIGYTITYELNGGTLPDGTENPIQYTYDMQAFTLINPVRTGYTFAGWTGTGISAPQTTVIIAAGSTGDKMFIANWNANLYYVQFRSNGGSGEMSALEYTYDVTYNLPANTFVKPNSVFLGWAFTENSDTPDLTDCARVSNLSAASGGTVILYAVWETSECTHDFIPIVTPPTCTEEGFTTYTCTICGEAYTDDFVPATGHAFGDWAYSVEDENCHERICENCGESEIAAHNFQAEVVEPTCTEEGECVYSCEDCGYAYAEEITPLGHSLREPQYENEIPATCDDLGSYDLVVYCAVCGEEISRETFYVDRLPHDPALPVPENRVEATCTADGSYDEVVYCNVCGTELSRQTIAIPATGHDYDAQVTAPTCLTQGYTTYICKNDPTHTYTDDFLPAQGHNWGVWVVVVQPTATEEGQEMRTCERCGATETRPLPPVPDAGLLALSGASAHPGGTVQITVSVQDNPGIVSALLKISYDASILTLIDVQNNNLLENADFYAGNDLTAVPYTVFWVDSLAQQDYTQNGVMATFTFKVADDAPIGETQITITYSTGSTLNKELVQVPFVLQNGAVDVTPRKPGDASGDGELSALDVVLIERYIAGGWDVVLDEINSDVDGDGEITLLDVVLLIRFLVGGWGVVL